MFMHVNTGYWWLTMGVYYIYNISEYLDLVNIPHSKRPNLQIPKQFWQKFANIDQLSMGQHPGTLQKKALFKSLVQNPRLQSVVGRISHRVWWQSPIHWLVKSPNQSSTKRDLEHCSSNTLWLFDIAMEAMAHRKRWFSLETSIILHLYHLKWGFPYFSMALLVITRG